MKTTRRARISVLAFGLASAAGTAAPPVAARDPAPPDAAASDVELAENYAAEAYEAYRVRDFGRAVLLYEKALAASPSADIIYNIARVYDLGLSNRRLAIDYYERFVADPGAASERLERANQRLIELRAAERASRGVTPPDADAIARDFPMDAVEAPPAPAPAPPPPPPVHSGLRPLEVGAIALGTAGLVGVGVGVAFGLAARSRSDDWQRDCDGNACTTQRGVDAAESAQRRASVATIGFASGGSLLALAAVFWLLDSDDEHAGDTSALRLSPSTGPDLIGGGVSGSF